MNTMFRRSARAPIGADSFLLAIGRVLSITRQSVSSLGASEHDDGIQMEESGKCLVDAVDAKTDYMTIFDWWPFWKTPS